MKLALLVLAAALSGVVPARALDPQRAVSQYVVKTWSATSLGSNSVHSIAQTDDGYLWLATGGGLVRYDGARFTTLTAKVHPELPDGGVSVLARGGDGTLYLGTTSGVLAQYHGGVFTRLANPGRAGPIQGLLVRPDGLWFGKDAMHPMQWTSDRLVTHAAARTLTTRTLAPGPGSAVWIGTRDGLLLAEAGRFTPHPGVRDSVQALHADRSGVLWIGTPHGLQWLDGDRMRRLTRGDGLCHDDVTSLVEDRDGNLWVGTSAGLIRVRRGGDDVVRVDCFSAGHGLADDDVRSLYEDREGTLWAGTANGLTAISDGGFVTYGKLEGVADGRTTAVIEGHDGSIWAGTASGQVVHWREGGARTFTLPERLGRASVVALYENGSGALWIATENGRLFRLWRGHLEDRTPRNASAQQRVSCFFEHDGGLMVFVTGIGAGRGLARLKPDAFAPLPGKGPALGYLHAVFHDARGTWLASSQGIGLLAGESLARWREGMKDTRIRWLTPDTEEGGLWLATAAGLAHFKEGRFQTVTAREGLPEGYLRVVLDDGLGHLWVGGAASLFRVSQREVRDVFAGKARQIAPVLFDVSDGLRTTEALPGNGPGFRATDGRLWFATAKGLAVVDPRRVSIDAPAPHARIETFTLDGRSEARTHYGPGRGELSVQYASDALSDRIRFRYRLEGLDDGWSDAGDARRAYYSSLQPGEYRFVVMASNRHGVWNGEPVARAFVLRPPFRQTPAFYALCAAAVAAASTTLYRLRLRQMRQRFAATVAERTRIARELHDTLAQGIAGARLQMDAGLDTIVQDPAGARTHFELAAAMARASQEEVRSSIWVLRAQTSKGADGIAAGLSDSLRQLTSGSGLSPIIEITGAPRELPLVVEHNLLRIVHEVVLNAVRHSGAAHLSVTVRFAADAVELVVVDDGRGFDTGAHRDAGGVQHFGLLGMRERAESLGGHLELRSRPGEGTEVTCRLPYDGPAQRDGGGPL